MTEDVVSLTEAKRLWWRLLQRVERGASFTITRSGRPVARLVPKEARTARHVLEPTIPLFESGISDLTSRSDEHLEGIWRALINPWTRARNQTVGSSRILSVDLAVRNLWAPSLPIR
jgi:prevent-host-death family protein